MEKRERERERERNKDRKIRKRKIKREGKRRRNPLSRGEKMNDQLVLGINQWASVTSSLPASFHQTPLCRPSTGSVSSLGSF